MSSAQTGNLLIGEEWQAGAGPAFAAINPATQATVWQGRSASAAQVQTAMAAARAALPAWSRVDVAARIAVLNHFAALLKEQRDALLEVISLETGKPRWEAGSEVDVMINKIPISIEAYQERSAIRPREASGAQAVARLRPHGVLAVMGPFNLPGHVPNGHIVPALLAGNTLVYKPSELTPGTGEFMARLWQEAGAPAGVFNLVQGAKDTGIALADPALVDGLLFTGSFAVGQILARRFAESPGRILALELGGNNPLIVWPPHDLTAAAYHTIQSAFVTTGQRCTCAARLIIGRDVQADAFLDRLLDMTRKLRAGMPTDQPEPFMGPVIHRAAADRLMQTQVDLQKHGGKSLLPMQRLGPALLSPGLLDVTAIQPRHDGELFGPLLQIIRVHTFEEALAEANHTRFGLAAGLLCDDAARYAQFARDIRAGVISWNRPTTNASSYSAFGGIGDSGNHRPTGYAAAEYCSYPVAALEVPALATPAKLAPGVTL